MTGSRRSVRGERPRRSSWGVVLLSLGVGATAVAVPPLVMSWSRTAAPVVPSSPATAAAVTGRTAPTGTASTATVSTGTASGAGVPTGRASSGKVPPGTTASGATRPSATPFRPIRIDAAAPGNRASGTAVTECPLCVSGRRVQYLGQGHWLIVPVRGVPVAGRRTLTIVYESAEARTLDVAVNDLPPVSLHLPGAGSWTSPARVTVPIELPRGDSEIKFFNERAPAPDLDRILIN